MQAFGDIYLKPGVYYTRELFIFSINSNEKSACIVYMSAYYTWHLTVCHFDLCLCCTVWYETVWWWVVCLVATTVCDWREAVRWWVVCLVVTTVVRRPITSATSNSDSAATKSVSTQQTLVNQPSVAPPSVSSHSSYPASQVSVWLILFVLLYTCCGLLDAVCAFYFCCFIVC